MSETQESVKQQVRDILATLTKDERELLSRVIKTEKQKIHMKKPHGIYDDLEKAIEEVIQ